MTKKNLILGGVLIVLLGLAFVYSGPFKEWKEDLGKPKNFLKSLDTKNIDKMEISDSGSQVVINKTDNGWLIEGTKDFYVKEQLITNAMSTLDEASESDVVLVSENADKKTEFEIDEASGVKVNLIGQDISLASFMVGKNGSDFKSSYISEIDKDQIYSVDANMSLAFRHGDWYDKTIFDLDQDKITKIRFQYPSREFSIEREKDEEGTMGEWSGILPYFFSTNQEKVEEVVRALANLQADEIPAQSFEGTGLEKNLAIIQLSGEELDEVIMIGDENEDGLYYAKRGDSDNIYLISADVRDILEKRISDLR